LRGLAHRYQRRLMLLCALRAAGVWPVAALSLAYTVSALLPAAMAAAMGLLIGGVERAAGGAAATTLPLALFASVLLLGHFVDAAVEPLRYLVKSRINGAQRLEVSRRIAAVATLERLEDPEVQDLIRIAAADPANWTEKTPGDGALAQLSLLARYAGAVCASAVLASYAWWLIPVILGPAFVGRALRSRDFAALAQLWASGARHGRRAEYWQRTIMSPAAAKEQRVYGFGEWAVDRVRDSIHAMLDPVWAFGMRLRWRTTATAALMFVPLGIAYATVAHAVAHGRATLAVETAVFYAGLAVYLAVGVTFEELEEIEGALPILRASEALRAEFGAAEPVAGQGFVPSPVARDRPPEVALSGIRFAYPGTDRLVFDGLNLTIHPSESLAIVGLNGAGKSTLIKLLAGLYVPDAGRISADGVDIRQIGVVAWRRRLSVVFQDFVRYELSIEENVTLGNPAALPDPAARDRAAAGAGLESVVGQLADGWRTPLSRSRTGGVDLSGGQWQQLVLARALYAVQTGAQILVLDEPTAHLDVRSEVELFERLKDRPSGTSVVLISHRLSTVRWADRIVLLDGGRVTESGTHEQLMCLDGGYAAMFRLQAERFAHGFDDRLDEEALP
jgi:ABC-type multidrug transport system fused ATPase/permease subunit